MNAFRAAVAASVSLAVGMGSARADLIAYEGFDHPAAVLTNLTGLAGGVSYPDCGWSGGWVHNYQSGDAASAIQSGSITYTGVVPHGNKVLLYRSITRTLAKTAGGPGGTVWIGLFHNFGGSKASGGWSLLSGASTVLSVTCGAPNSSGTNFLDGVNSGVPASTGTRFYLTRIDFSPTGNTAYLWINPSLSAEPNIGTANATKTYPTNWTFNQMRVLNSSAISNIVYADEIRVGTAFRDALVPTTPPSGTLLLIR